MIVYGDILFAENFIIGCVLIRLMVMFYGERMSVLRMAAGGIMCGMFSMVIFLMLPSYLIMLLQIPFSVAVSVVSSGKKNLIRKSVIFVFVTYFMGGITMVIFMVTENDCIYTPAAIYSGDMKAVFLVVSVSVFVIVVRHIIAFIRDIRFENEYMAEAIIKSGESHLKVTAFTDTGNNLRDPVSGRPVCVASEKLWEEMEDAGMIKPERIRLVPYESVGGRGMLLAVRVDEICLGNVSWRKCVVAKNEFGFNCGGSHRAELLIAGQLIWEGR